MTYQPVSADDWIAAQPKHVQDAGEARAKQLIAEHTLRQVREAVSRTQVEVAAAAGTTQDRVSKLERSDDLMVSTLEKHIKALGGCLRLMVEFPDRPPVAVNLKGGKPVARSTRTAV